MSFYADLHIHSKYSRATSKNCDLENLAYWARKKGIAVVGTGDFTHPAWRAELVDKLVPAEPGLFRLREDIERKVERRVSVPGQCATRFLLSVEISTIYKSGDRTRKVHHLVYAPDFESVDRMVKRLSRIGNLSSDGRPILGLSSRDLLEIVLEASEHAYLIPAHAWTPWFSVLGSRSGFDDVAECYGDLGGHIFAIETGLSSDPPMNWRLSRLDRYTLVSNSDAHSPAKLGREACVFHTGMDYFAMRRALETREGYGGTVEFFPEEGKYHLDGHRKCSVVLDPEETRALEGICPVCHKPLTIGVMHRVQELADRPPGFQPDVAPPFRSLVPLPEVIAEIAGTGAGSKTVGRSYESLLTYIGPEFFILDSAPVEDIRRRGSSQLAEAISRMRAGKVICKPGFDGEYGVIRLFEEQELRRRRRGESLFLCLPEGEGGCSPDQPTAVAPTNPTGGGDEPTERPPPQAGASMTEGASAPAEMPETPGATRGPGGSHEVLREAGAVGPTDELRTKELSDEDGGTEGNGDGHGDVNDLVAAEDGPLAALDPEQRSAAAVTDGPLLIIAGPGTGKTRTLTHRIAHLISRREVAPEACLAITFTNRAAEEMRERLQGLLPELGARIWVKTFHGLAFAMLQENRQLAGLHRGFRVADEAERIALMSRILGCSQRKARSMLARISRAKRMGTTLSANSTGAEPVVRSVVESMPVPMDESLLDGMNAYRAALEAESLIDFDDLLVRTVALLESEELVRRAYQERFRYISIDEYQDIDELQYRLIDLLCPVGQDRSKSGSLCVIGDPDQAIYGFRGADVALFLRFRSDFAGAREVHLTRNYRSTRTIVDASMQAIAPSSLVGGRVLSAMMDDAGRDASRIEVVETASERAEAELVVRTIETLVGGTSFFSLDSGRVGQGDESDLSFSDFAVLYRTDALAEPLCEAFTRSGIPFQKRSHDRLSDRAVVRDLVAGMHAALADGLLHCKTAVTDSRMSEQPLLGLLRQVGKGLQARWVAEAAQGARAEGQPNGHPYGHDDIDEAMTMLAPLALRSGDDAERFFAEIAMGIEVDLWDPRADRVSLLTLHASKGLEFRVVFVVGCEDGILPLRWGVAQASQADDSPRAAEAGEDEERRLFFVGMTRARTRLYLTRARKRMWRGKVREQEISPFVRAIGETLLLRQNPRVGNGKKSQVREQLGLF